MSTRARLAVTRRALEEATDSRDIVRLRERERILRGRIEEAVRGAARKVIELKRLPDGKFAPKGLGTVLRPGQDVSVPNSHRGPSNSSRFVAGEVTPDGKVLIKGGPDGGTKIPVVGARFRDLGEKPPVGTRVAVPVASAGLGEDDRIPEAALIKGDSEDESAIKGTVVDYGSGGKGKDSWVKLDIPETKGSDQVIPVHPDEIDEIDEPPAWTPHEPVADAYAPLRTLVPKPPPPQSPGSGAFREMNAAKADFQEAEQEYLRATLYGEGDPAAAERRFRAARARVDQTSKRTAGIARSTLLADYSRSRRRTEAAA